MARREMEEKGNQREPKGTKRKPNGSQRGAKGMPKGCQRNAKRIPKRMQKGARVKKAAPKASFAEQERTNLKKGYEKSANVCQKVTKIEASSMPTSKTSANTGIEKEHEHFQESLFFWFSRLRARTENVSTMIQNECQIDSQIEENH